MTQGQAQRQADVIAFNDEIMREFREHGGQVGGRFAESTLLILGTTGAKSGQQRVSPLAYLAHDDRLYVFAAGPHAPHYPHWYFNLLADPRVTVEVGTEVYPAVASVLEGEGRDRIWALFVAQIPQLPGWQRDAGREFPMIELTRMEETMNDRAKLVDQVEREVLTWPGVSREFRRSPVGDAAIYWVGKRQIGHIHTDGVADLQFPKTMHDALIAEGKARPHRGGFAAVVSYDLRQPADVPGAIELFRLSYDRTRATTEGRSTAA